MAKTATTRPEATDVAAFLAGVPDAQRRADAEAVLRMMQAVTGCPPVMWGGSIVGFDRYRPGGSGSTAADWPIVGFSPRKQALVLYLTPGFEAQAALLARLGRHTLGKSCLYLKRLADVDGGVLEALVRASVDEMRRRHPA